MRQLRRIGDGLDLVAGEVANERVVVTRQIGSSISCMIRWVSASTLMIF